MVDTPETTEDDVFDQQQVKGRVDPISRLARQLERCNLILGEGNIETFESSVLALKGDLPLRVKECVLARKDEFNSAPVEWKYIMCCGQRVGTPKNPLISVKDHPDWEFMNQVPKPFREEYQDRIEILSPIRIDDLRTDYIDLFEIIKEELEKAGLTWTFKRGGEEE